MTPLPSAASPAAGLPRRVGVVGSGLIGASIGLALRRVGVEVLLRDTDPEQVKLAEAMGAGSVWQGERVEHAVVAVPPHAVAAELRAVQVAGIAATASDVASVKSRPIAEAVVAGVDLTAWCPAHPIAGRERGGAASAQADLFAERTWVLCPIPHTSAAALAATEALARACGALPVRATPARHDEAMAALSHLPQVVSSLLAAAAPDLRPGEVALAGQGFRDATRLAESDPTLWSSILEGNRGPVAAHARRLAAELGALADALDHASEASVTKVVTGMMERGRAGRAQLPRKAGTQAARPWGWVGVVLDDRPGQLAALLTAIGEWQVNLEDIGPFEHSLEAPAGVIELAVAPEVAGELVDRLIAAGWVAYHRS
ncbi:prephenate dehydrogenase [Frankia sp. CNm7]|uniref:Prephenate dehydrogenase n=1 Tax=Frankia nepalensis TaxID=1836974 RepID=A0A937UQ55_9ACTN|nr:prephenate dehydrogenase [Frankia nepalensis]MBL7497783.1 prephenate dehydrogenase [Frankia nepalensis]MBL7511286.1 prephenate dehydrogenase [Frankia nepalensis]MBL7521299.1 prephenate dehydrogenase [Frankia nepalensis]MBL7629852.1 prephenate dehydrogenase [Frankia nepalensis]